jgi:hypothetical protein
MPKETIRNLAVDVERVLVAGAHLAGGDAGLLRDKAALDKLITQLGAKAPPVLSRLSEQADKALTAGPKDQADALVSFAMSLAQVRAAQASLATVGEDAPLAAVPAVSTPCNAKDLYALHDALVHTQPGRMAVINDALERDDVADLRLVHAAIQAMGDAYGELAETVSSKVVPRFGRAIVEPVRSRLRFPGKAIDGRRLKALVAVEKEAARPLIEQALKEGSAEMREAALEAMADSLPGVPDLEPLVLGLIEKERAGDVRRAAIRALKGYASDASLETLIAATFEPRTLREASWALSVSRHPKVIARLLERLATAATAAKAKPKKDAKDERNLHRDVANWMLRALSHYADPRVVEVARELADDYSAESARAVLNGGSPDDLRWLADQLAGTNTDLFQPAVEAAIKLEDETFDRLIVPIRAVKEHETKAGRARLDAVVDSNLVPKGDRWVTALLDALTGKPRVFSVVKLLARTKDRRATRPLVDLIETMKRDSNATHTLFYALGTLGDPSALEPLLAAYASKQGQGSWWSLAHSIVELADVSAVDKVRTILAAEKTESYQTRHLLRRLEQKFPGA